MRLLCPWNFSGKNAGAGCHFLLQGIFLTQGSNPLSPALAGEFFTAEPPGKLHSEVLIKCSLTNARNNAKQSTKWTQTLLSWSHSPDQKEVLGLSKKPTPEAAAESPTFPKIADSRARSQRRKLVENYEL